MESSPVTPHHLLVDGQLSQPGALEIARDGLTLHQCPVGTRLLVLHDEGGVQEAAGDFELQFPAPVLPVVHDARIGQGSPHGRETLVIDSIIHDLVSVQQVQTVSPGLPIDLHS